MENSQHHIILPERNTSDKLKEGQAMIDAEDEEDPEGPDG